MCRMQTKAGYIRVPTLSTYGEVDPFCLSDRTTIQAATAIVSSLIAVIILSVVRIGYDHSIIVPVVL